MATQNGGNSVLAFVLGAALVGLIVLGYVYYQRTHRDVVKIDVPGIQGEISKDKGVDIQIGKDRYSRTVRLLRSPVLPLL